MRLYVVHDLAGGADWDEGLFFCDTLRQAVEVAGGAADVDAEDAGTAIFRIDTPPTLSGRALILAIGNRRGYAGESVEINSLGQPKDRYPRTPKEV